MLGVSLLRRQSEANSGLEVEHLDELRHVEHAMEASGEVSRSSAGHSRFATVAAGAITSPLLLLACELEEERGTVFLEPVEVATRRLTIDASAPARFAPSVALLVG